MVGRGVAEGVEPDPGLLILHIRDGLITRVRDYMDGLAVARIGERMQ